MPEFNVSMLKETIALVWDEEIKNKTRGKIYVKTTGAKQHIHKYMVLQCSKLLYIYIYIFICLYIYYTYYTIKIKFTIKYSIFAASRHGFVCSSFNGCSSLTGSFVSSTRYYHNNFLHVTKTKDTLQKHF